MDRVAGADMNELTDLGRGLGRPRRGSQRAGRSGRGA